MLKRASGDEWRANALQAINDFDRALAIDPEMVPTLFNRGNAHRRNDDPAHAALDYSLVLALEPDHGLAYFSRAGAHRALGDAESALEDLETFLRLGGEALKLSWRRRLAKHGVYRRDVDGAPPLRQSIRACIADPTCYLPAL